LFSDCGLPVGCWHVLVVVLGSGIWDRWDHGERASGLRGGWASGLGRSTAPVHQHQV
jgi:hypothetical protein